jgi:hypothetical protein
MHGLFYNGFKATTCVCNVNLLNLQVLEKNMVVIIYVVLASCAQNSPISWWRPTFKAAMEEYVGILYPIL